MVHLHINLLIHINMTLFQPQFVKTTYIQEWIISFTSVLIVYIFNGLVRIHGFRT